MIYLALLNSRVRMVRNALKGSAARQRWGWFGMTIAWSVIAIWVSLALVTELRMARTPYEMRHALEALFFYVSALMLLSAAPLTFAAMFQSQDLGWLLATPTSPLAISCLKVVDGMIGSSRVFLPICLPAYGATCWALHLTPLGWLFALLLWVALVIFIGLMVEFLLLMVARSLSVTRVQSTMVALNFILCVGLVLVITQNPDDNMGRIPLMKMPVPDFIVTGFAAKAMMDWANGAQGSGFMYLLSLSCLCALIAFVVAQQGRKIYADVRLSEAVMKGPRFAVKQGRNYANRSSGLLAGISRKDLRYYFREPQLLSQVAAPLLLIIMPFMFAAHTRDQWGLVQMAAITMVGTTLYLQTSILSISSIGLEGRNYWMIKVSPVPPLHFLFAKWLFCVRFTTTTMLALTILMWVLFQLPLYWVTLMLISGAIASMTLSGLGIGLSALFPRFIYDNPAQRVSVWAMLWGFVLYITYIITIGVAFFATWKALSLGSNTTYTWIIFVFYLTLISLCFGLVPMVLGAKKLAGQDFDN